MVHIEEELDFSEAIDVERIAEDCLARTIDYVDCRYDCDIEVLIVNEKEIQSINKMARGIDKATDVLSFPYTEFDAPGELPDAEMLDFHPDTGELLLGQIVICAPICENQAKEYGHSIAREFAFLITHSLLHLFGYDHMVKDEEEVMCKAQEEILTKAGYTRD